MAANRKVGWLATATVLGVLFLFALFQAGDGDVLRPVREAADRLPDGPGPVPGIVSDDARPAEPPEKTTEKHAAPASKDPDERRVPLEIAVIDGETGAALLEAQPRLQVDKTHSLALRPSGGVFVHPKATCAVRRTAHVRATIDLPDGYGLENPGPQFVRGRVSLYAERVRVTFAAWRYAVVMVRVVDFEGNPVAGARITSASIMGRGREFTAKTTGADGWTRVWGIPALHGETVSVRADTSLRHQSAKAVIVDSWTPARLRVTLPKEPNNHMIGIGGGAGGAFSGRGDRRALRRSGRESIVVKVVHRDGRPAAHTMVLARGKGISRSGRTDASGRIELNGLHAGEVTVEVTEAGFVMGQAVPVTVLAGTPVDVTIVEAPQRWITGLVLDEWGHALPSVRLVVTSGLRGRLVYLDRGLQRLNFLSGPDGRFAFPNVPPGSVTIDAAYGTRKTRARAGDAGIATVRFPPKK